MKVSDNLRLALRMFRTRPLRTSLTILGVSVGIGTVLFLVSFGYGLQQAILSRIANADTLLTIDVSAGSEVVQLTDDAVKNITAIPHVQEVSRLANFHGQIALRGINTDTVAVAVDPSFFRLDGQAAVQGKLFEGAGTGSAILSTAAVKLVGSSPETAVGEQASMFITIPQKSADGSDSQPKGLSGSAMVTGVVENEDMSQLYLPLSLFRGMKIPHYDRLKVRVESNQYIEQVRSAIIDQGYVVSTLSDTIDQAKKIFGIVQIVLGLFGLVALGVSAIGMFNTMTITLLERTNEIGIMRSIGVTRRDIRSMFLVESMLMGFLGGLTGLVLSTVAGKALNFALNLLAQKYHGPQLDVFLTPLWFAAVVIAFSTVIGFCTGVYPSYRASKLNPLEALRYK